MDCAVDAAGWSQLHRQAGSVPGLHPRLHAGPRPPAGRGGHAAPLPREPSFGAPDGAHAGAGRADPAEARSRPQHRGARGGRSPARPTLTPTRQILRAGELGAIELLAPRAFADPPGELLANLDAAAPPERARAWTDVRTTFAVANLDLPTVCTGPRS